MDPRLITVTEDPINAETPLALQRGVITPNDLFFMRNRFSIPELEPEKWHLAVSGEVERPAHLSYTDLLAMPGRTLRVTLECAGNGRVAMTPAVEGEPWCYGAVSTAEWTGVPLYLILEAAGLKETAREIVIEGSDRGSVDETRRDVPFARSLPLEKAMDPDTILAYTMNGEVLPVAHGFPLRLVVPGWYGMSSVKWVSSIRAVPDTFRGYFQVERYVLADDVTGDIRPLGEAGIRSIITTPQDGATISSGRHMLRGFAWSGAAPVTEIEVSADGGASWQPAGWSSPEEPYVWRSWEYLWDAGERGPALLKSRARDRAGNIQPSEGTWNRLGYANNAIQAVRVTVE